MRGLTRGLAAIGLALAVGAGAGACATRPGYDEIVLYYKAGARDDRKFQECIPPGQSGSYPVDDETFSLPTTLRTWSVRKDGSGDSNQPIDTGSKFGADGQPGPHVLTFTTSEFYLNTNCGTGKLKDKDPDSPIVQFWQNIGTRPWGKDNKPLVSDGGDFDVDAWKAMLENTLVAAEEKVLADGTRFFTADELDSNAHGERTQLERRLAPFFQRELRAKLGGDYFCGVGYKRNTEATWTEYVADGVDEQGAPKIREEQRKGSCPPVRISITDVDFANPEIAQSRANVYKAEQDAKAKLTAAQAELEQSRILGQAANNDAYLRYKAVAAQAAAAEACKANPNCTVIIDGRGGGGVNVNAGK